MEIEARYEDKSAKCTIVGVTAEFKNILNYEPSLGVFLDNDHHRRELRICVLGEEVERTLFPV